MSRKPPKYTETISLRVTPKEKEDLIRLCAALNTSISEFIRKYITNVSNQLKINLNK